MAPDDFKAWRTALGLNQEQAAAALGLSRASVLNYERGTRREDDRPVTIPLTVELACAALSIDEAAKRQDINLVPMAWKGRLRRLKPLL